ncbi:hypothetical protein THEYE_A1222 [Thermodesulfovibrio yellowstonii DSM 11347]|uniref:Uncharacterized protein n=1 Tax=Thermodesulfovibrio yellowstonii (strain ATCC 51303 / DSM 11347 / YP87) TaxID=289376 RepID=B5YLC6_THEYD|nr:hypothetical protein THEYE_A1222 [Thermodesulfovibrio yellowstonii DSM 11347]
MLAIEIACLPLMRIIPIPPSPKGVLIAAIVSNSDEITRIF